MTRAIEHLIRMHDPLCVSIESLNVGKGAGTLGREQILGAFAATQHQHSVGYDLLLLKFRNDANAGSRLKTAIRDWACKHSHLQYRVESCVLALNLVTQLPLPNQISRSATLIRRYSPKANQYRKNISEIGKQVKSEEEQMRTDKAIYGDEFSRYEYRVDDLNALANLEKTSFKKWSIQEAHKTILCQKCRGAGTLLKPQPRLCSECAGSGKILPKLNDIRLSLRIIGAKLKEGEFDQEYQFLINNCLDWLYAEESDAAAFLAQRIKNEKEYAQEVDPILNTR